MAQNSPGKGWLFGGFAGGVLGRQEARQQAGRERKVTGLGVPWRCPALASGAIASSRLLTRTVGRRASMENHPERAQLAVARAPVRTGSVWRRASAARRLAYISCKAGIPKHRELHPNALSVHLPPSCRPLAAANRKGLHLRFTVQVEFIELICVLEIVIDSPADGGDAKESSKANLLSLRCCFRRPFCWWDIQASV